MSITPSVPNLVPKTFWQKPEGKLGMGVVICGVIAAGFGLVAIWPLIMALLTSMFTLVGLVVGIVTLGFLAFNPQVHNLVGNGFRLVMRKITGIMVEIDPIGILENTRDQMQENCAKLGKAVSGVRGALQLVINRISANATEIRKQTLIKERADKDIAQATNTLQKQRLGLSRKMSLEEIGRRMKSNDNLTEIKKQTERMYGMLVRWQDLADFNVQNMSAEITNAKAQRETLLKAYAGMSLAKKIIQGDPEQLKVMNADLEFLAEDAASKVGDMEDFTRYSEKYLTQMDLEQGANADEAEKMLEGYENKLLSAGGTAETVPAQISTSEGVTVPRGAAASQVVDADYLDT